LVEPLFFFGAGASRPFDIPTMKEMVSEFQKELANSSGKGIRDEVHLYSQVAASIKQAYGRVDLESVFTVVDAIAQGKTLKDLGYFATFLAKSRRFATLLRPSCNSKGDEVDIQTSISLLCYLFSSLKSIRDGI
jgi:hypothetical protein